MQVETVQAEVARPGASARSGVPTRRIEADRVEADRRPVGGRFLWGRRPSLRLVTGVLGAIWFVDGLLQLQPSMFTTSFVTGTLAGAAQGQPWWVYHSVTHVAHDLMPHIAQWNVVFALVQLTIGLCLVANRAVKPALAASVAWSFGVWWFGEAFGGIFSGNASLVTGAPGAVFLYGLLALMVWPRRSSSEDGPAPMAAAEGVVGARRGRLFWAVLWVGSAVLQVLPANRSDASISSALRAGAAGEPHALAALVLASAGLVGSHGSAVAITLAVVEVAVGLGILTERPNVALAAGIGLSLVFWVVGQQLGGILTGTGTDPNAGPLFVVMALVVWKGMPKGETARARGLERTVKDRDGAVGVGAAA
ncbi:MAG: hypothetical protein ACP5P9_00370 [Acidimicrobiales bacterium]